MQLTTVLKIKMTRMLLYLLHFLLCAVISAHASKVTLDFNRIATDNALGMVCSVKDREKESLIKLFHGIQEKVTLSAGCIINSNDTRLNIRCTETGDGIQLSVNLTYYNSSDLGTWNCSDGNSSDTVTFPSFVRHASIMEFGPRGPTFICIVHQECNIVLTIAMMHRISPRIYLRTIEGNTILVFRRHQLMGILDDEWRRRMVINDNNTFPYLNFTLLDVVITDAGIYYLTDEIYDFESFGFLIRIADFPKQPAVSQREAESNISIYELLCASESKSQPVFSRKPLSYIWRLNGHNLTEVQPCFRWSGPVLILFPDACKVGMNGSISITCAAAEEGLESDESQPFIIPISRVLVAESPKGFAIPDQKRDSISGALVGASLGSFIIGIIIALLSVVFVTKKRGTICKKEHKEPEGTNDVSTDNMYVNTIITGTHVTATEGEVRQYESLDNRTIEHTPHQYDAIYLKGCGQQKKEDAYEVV